MNIIIESSLYGPKKVSSELFGKTIEEIEWDRIKKIPEGSFDIESGQLRIRAKNNKIQGIEIFSKDDKKSESKTKRKLNTIPTG